MGLWLGKEYDFVLKFSWEENWGEEGDVGVWGWLYQN